MDTTKKITIRDAFLPMALMSDGDLELINNSNLDPHMRDTAVYFMMAVCLLDSGTRCLRWYDQDELEPLLKLLADKGYTDMVNIINNRSK